MQLCTVNVSSSFRAAVAQLSFSNIYSVGLLDSSVSASVELQLYASTSLLTSIFTHFYWHIQVCRWQYYEYSLCALICFCYYYCFCLHYPGNEFSRKTAIIGMYKLCRQIVDTNCQWQYLIIDIYKIFLANIL